MSEERKSVAIPRALKCVAFSVAGLLLGAGLCGLDAHLYPHSEFGGSSMAPIGLLLIVVSGLVLVVSVVVLVVAAALQASRK